MQHCSDVSLRKSDALQCLTKHSKKVKTLLHYFVFVPNTLLAMLASGKDFCGHQKALSQYYCFSFRWIACVELGFNRRTEYANHICSTNRCDHTRGAVRRETTVSRSISNKDAFLWIEKVYDIH